MKYHEARQHLLREKLEPVYLLYGEEPYLVEECIRIIKRRLLTPETMDFNFHQFYGDETSAAEITGTAHTATLFAPQRLVVMRRVQSLPPRELKKLLPYVVSPSSTTVLVLVGDKLEGKSAWIRELSKHAKMIRFYPLFANEALTWVKAKVQQAGYQITHEAAQALTEHSGTDLFRLKHELDKLISYLGRPGRITKHEVDLLTGHGRHHTVFELVDAIGEKRAELALRKVYALLSAGEHPLFILALVARQFRLLWQAKELQSRRHTGAEVGKRLGLRGGGSQKIMSQVRRFSEPEIRAAFQALLEADLRLKTTTVPPEQVLISTIVGLISPA